MTKKRQKEKQKIYKTLYIKSKDLQNITHKTKDPVTRTLITTGGELMSCGRVSSSCFANVMGFFLFCTDFQDVKLLNHQPSSEHDLHQGRRVLGLHSFPVQNSAVNLPLPQ